MLNNKIILITGGTGSFGKKATEIILKNYKPKKLIIFSRDELKQFDMAQQFKGSEGIRYFIGDVRDKERLQRAFHRVDYVIPLHFTGQSCEMGRIYGLSKKYNFNIIEDACHAIGGR
jgi:FlaA1/EpsC-like NDP-sugar epimerase